MLEDAQNDHINSAKEDILVFFSALPILQTVAGEMSLLRTSNALHLNAISGFFFGLLVGTVKAAQFVGFSVRGLVH